MFLNRFIVNCKAPWTAIHGYKRYINKVIIIIIIIIIIITIRTVSEHCCLVNNGLGHAQTILFCMTLIVITKMTLRKFGEAKSTETKMCLFTLYHF